MPESENKCFLGIADLFFNLMITLKTAGIEVDKLSYRDCNEFGNILVKHGQEQNYKVYMVLSREHTSRFYSDYYEFVEEATWDNVKGIKLKKEVTTNELIDECRGYIPLTMLLIIINNCVMTEVVRYYQEAHNLSDDDIKSPLFKHLPVENKEPVRDRKREE